MFGNQTQSQVAATTQAHTEVRISALGVVTIEGKNFTGDACSIMGNVLREAIGGGDTDLKPEYFQTSVEDTTNVTNW